MITVSRETDELLLLECEEVVVRKKLSEEAFEVLVYTKKSDKEGNPELGSEVRIIPKEGEMIEIRTSCGRKLATVVEKKATWVAK
jgi:hypothetical protein